MPLHRLLRLSPTAALGLWHRTETIAALGALLPAGGASYAHLLPAAGPDRQGQWLAGRVLAHAVAAELWPGAPGLLVQNRQNYAQDLQLSIRGFGARSTFGVRGVRLIADRVLHDLHSHAEGVRSWSA